MSTSMKIGWAEVSIVPDKKISMAGQFYERISEGVETPITVTALAVECAGESMVMCSCDLIQTYDSLLKNVRQRLEGQIDCPLDKIILHATHTHASHLYKSANKYRKPAAKILPQFVPADMLYKPLVTLDDSIMTGEEAAEFLADRIAKSVKEAWENRRAGMYACGFGRAAVGMNRRACYDDGTAQMWGDTNTPNFTHLEGGNDNGVEMLFTFDADKNLTGVILNVACPAQVMEHRNVISSDYWGKVKFYLREKYGEDLFVLGLCSPAGDQCPRDLIRWQAGETPVNDPNISRPHYIERRSDGSMFDIQGTNRIGRRIANEVFAAYEEIEEYFANPVFVHETKTIELPIRRVTLTEYEVAKAEIEKFIEKNRGKTFDYKDTAAMYVHAGTIDRYECQQDVDVFPIETHFIRLGDVAFATNPFELFLDYGSRIRARSFAKQTFLIQLSCGGYGYLPTEKAEQGGHYSAYVTSGMTDHVGGDMLVRYTLNEINGMFHNN